MFGIIHTLALNIEPVPKHRERITTNHGYPRLMSDPKTSEFESSVERITRFATKSKPTFKGYKGRLAAEIIFLCSHKRGDSDNYCKSLLDGLEKSEFFDNDNKFDLLVIRRHFVEKGQEAILLQMAEYTEPAPLDKWLVVK